jgi:hypothetical protein
MRVKSKCAHRGLDSPAQTRRPMGFRFLSTLTETGTGSNPESSESLITKPPSRRQDLEVREVSSRRISHPDTD